MVVVVVAGVCGWRRRRLRVAGVLVYKREVAHCVSKGAVDEGESSLVIDGLLDGIAGISFVFYV